MVVGRPSLPTRLRPVDDAPVLTHWSAASVAEVFKIPPRDAVELVVRLGSYPGALPLREDRARWTAYVRDAIVEPAIGRDLLALGPIRAQRAE